MEREAYLKIFDTIVIGSGGGTKLVRPVADLGKKVAVIEKESPGGTCLNRGCIPSKMLIYPASIIHHTKDLTRIQLQRNVEWKVDFSKLITRISNEVDEESESIPPIYEKHPNIEYFNNHARFISDKVIKVSEETLTADKIFIAVGGRPLIPNVIGLIGTPYWTSREALRNTTLPKRLIVYGCGYIGMELGMAYAAFGTEVTFITRSNILREEDAEIRVAFQSAIQNKVKILTGYTIHKVNYQNSLFRIQLSDPTEPMLEADALLIATGIVPNTDDLGIENTGIQLDPKGFIKTDQFLETTVKNIYALGDCNGRYFFRHSVNYEGEYLFNNLFLRDRLTPIQYPPVPHAVFTYPEIASVGLTEDACLSGGLDYVKALHPFKESAMGMARIPEFGLVKLLVDRSSRKLLGAHILGDEASNLIHTLILGMTLGCKLEDYLKMIFIHPSLPEVIRNAFRKIKSELGAK